VPDIGDIKKIERIIGEVGEKELELGELHDRSAGEEPFGEEPFVEGEQPSSVLPPEGLEEEDGLAALLKDIDAGLEEERELDEKFRERPEGDGFTVEEKAAVAGPGVFEGEPEEETSSEEGFDLPLDFDMEKVAVREGPSEDLMRKAGVAKTKEEPQPEKKKELSKKERSEPLKAVEQEGSEIEALETEFPPEGEGESARPSLEGFEEELRGIEGLGGDEIAKEEETAEESFVLPDLEEAVEGGAEGVREAEAGEEFGLSGFEAESPVTEPEIGVFEFPEFEQAAPAQSAPVERAPVDEAAASRSREAQGSFDTGPSVEPERVEDEAPAEFPEIEGIDVPEFEAGETGPSAGPEGEGEVGESSPEEMPPEAGFAPDRDLSPDEVENESPTPAEPRPREELELSDEDIVLITAKIKQLSVPLAAQVRDVILEAALPADSMKGLLSLLIQDSPEQEIGRYVEWATGKKIVPMKRRPGLAPSAGRPRPLEALTENLGPLVRVGGLFAAIIVILGAIYWIFIDKSLKADRHYREGIEEIRTGNFGEAERSFAQALARRPKIGQFDRFGWEYMLAGNYDGAEKKFNDGIAQLDDPRSKFGQPSVRVANVKIWRDRAFLMTILGRYEEANKDYDTLVSLKPEVYEYRKLKGKNLVDWGKKDAAVREAKFKEAYDFFRDAHREKQNRKNPDPLFQMLAIAIERSDNKSVDVIRGVLKTRFPAAVDREVHPELARYLMGRGETREVWKILTSVIKRYPDDARPYFYLSSYFRIVDKKDEEESALNQAINKEKARDRGGKLLPWEAVDRRLISDSYNNIGEIYARTQIEGKYAEAVTYFKQAIQEDESNPKAYFNLAQAYFYGERNYALARRNYEKADSLQFRDNGLSYNLGLIYFFDGEFDNSLKRWFPLSQLDPENANVSFALGTLFIHMEKYQSALGELLRLADFYDRRIEEIGQLKPWHPRHKLLLRSGAAVYNNLGVSYQKLYETSKERNYQRDALVSLYRGGELADMIGAERGKIQFNIQYILHPKVIRSDMAINDDMSDRYEMSVE
jgi:tetratricopeptide (TPR) repeat protein